MSSSVTSELRVSGMTCSNCARHVTEALQAVPGVQSAAVNLAAGRASVRWMGGNAGDAAALLAALDSAGYPAKPISAGAAAEPGQAQAAWHANLWLGGMVTLALMIGEWVFDLGMTPWFQWMSFALAGVVQGFAGAQFYRGAWRQLKVGSSNMDTLVALGSTTAFAYSTWALVAGRSGHVYFMEAASIITLISIGHWIEARVSAKASQALQSLLHLAPPTARRIQVAAAATAPARFNPLEIRSFKPQAARQTVEVEVPVSELQSGDLVALRPGDRVPVDGVVAEGNSAVDESMLTGESGPVDKQRESELYAGTANLNGRLVLRVTATGESTALAHIIAAVQRAQTSRAHIQRLGDRVSSVFVPIVVAIALGAALWWGLAPASAGAVHHWLAQFLWPAHPPTGAAAAFIIASAVLIIACPCAMGLATPAAIMASANAAAQRGLLIRDGVALEKAGQITAVVLDKTGTLTFGEMTMTGPVLPAGAGTSVERVQQLAAALARNSSHPVSQRLAQLGNQSVEFSDWRELAGAGIQARRRGAPPESGELRLGSLRWLQASGVKLGPGDEQLQIWNEQGARIVGLAEGGIVLGLFAFRDIPKAAARQVVKQLSADGLGVFLLSGDSPAAAAGIARETGIAPENVFAEVRPEAKAEFIRKLQARGERVAFVGDGINDAPALEQADLGIAVGKASDVAREAADIILLRSDIEAIPEAMGLARATLRTIRQNLFWAFCYNAVGVPLAALGFLSPVLCAAAMGFSDLIVIGNALRLRRWKLRS